MQLDFQYAIANEFARHVLFSQSEPVLCVESSNDANICNAISTFKNVVTAQPVLFNGWASAYAQEVTAWIQSGHIPGLWAQSPAGGSQ